jgi:hypothetical protein
MKVNLWRSSSLRRSGKRQYAELAMGQELQSGVYILKIQGVILAGLEALTEPSYSLANGAFHHEPTNL